MRVLLLLLMLLMMGCSSGATYCLHLEVDRVEYRHADSYYQYVTDVYFRDPTPSPYTRVWGEARLLGYWGYHFVPPGKVNVYVENGIVVRIKPTPRRSRDVHDIRDNSPTL